MKRGRIWIGVLALAVCCGILLGTVLFVALNLGWEENWRDAAYSGGTQESQEPIQILTETAESDSEQDITETEEPGSEQKLTETEETGSEQKLMETEEPVTEQRITETEDFSAYYGTYVPKDGKALMVDLGEGTAGVSKPHLISEKALLSVDAVKRSADGKELLGYIDYFGLCLWVPLEKMEKISARDYSVQIGDVCMVCEDWSAVTFKKQPRKDSGIYDVSFRPGDMLKVLDMENGYFETAYFDVSAGSTVLGWVNGDYVTKLHTEYPYQMVCSESNDVETIPFYLELPGAADIVIGEEDGSIGEGSVLWFEQFSDGWGYTNLNGKGVWVSMMNAVPVSETQAQKVLSSVEYEKEPEGRTDFYIDGRVVAAEEYILPEAQQRVLEDRDVEGLTLKGLSYAKNELYAKYGRKFDSKELADYMKSKTWYVPKYEPRTYDDLIVSEMVTIQHPFKVH
ncbi:MAG: YARHG domain-containing protein [Lachnospiraceae bacterium]|nr:YARHG domain-containing protein [Lachnospiraceae bacterium]